MGSIIFKVGSIGLTVSDILNRGSWPQMSTWQRFYNKPIISGNEACQAWKSDRKDHFVIVLFPSLIKDGNNNLFPQIHLHKTNAFF